MKKQCPICGAENSEQAQFCRYCGTGFVEEPVSVEAQDAAASQHPNDPEAPPVKKEKSGKPFPVIPVLLAVMVLIAVIAVYALVQSFQTDLPSNSELVGTDLEKLETWYVTNAADMLTMYSEASADSAVLGELSNGSSVKVRSKSGTYWYIYAEELGLYGYVDKAHLTADKRAVVYSTGETGEERLVGPGDAPQKYASVKYVYVGSGSLALRSAPETNDSNAIGELYNYNPVYVIDSGSLGEYWYVYSPNLKMYGYVNSSYLIGAQKPPKEEEEEDEDDKDSEYYYVSVKKGYLALRNAKAFDAANEIGKLNNGDKVKVLDRSGTYWYVYAPTLGKYGYVNGSYLVKK